MNRLGTIIDGKYRLDAVLGAGGMATVFRARHLKLDRDVALKMLHHQTIANGKGLERFLQEARTESSLKHANVLSVHAFGVTQDNQLYLVMDYLNGRSLADYLKDGPLRADIACGIFLQICAGLAHAHARGVIHRDLKPSNVMIEGGLAEPHARIVDFGIARLIDEQPSTQRQRLTKTGCLLGTPAYMSPEQCTAGNVDHRTDIYSLGCLMFETLTGSRPFSGSSEYAVISKHVSAEPPLFHEVNAAIDVSPYLEEIVLKALQKDPRRRFQTGDELAEAILDAGSPSGKTALRRPAAAARQGPRAALRGPTKIMLSAVVAALSTAIVSGWGMIVDATNSLVRVPFLQAQIEHDIEHSGMRSAPVAAERVELGDTYMALHRVDEAKQQYAMALAFLQNAPYAVRARAPQLIAASLPDSPNDQCIQAIKLAGRFEDARELLDADTVLKFAACGLTGAPRWSRVAAFNALIDLLLREHQIRLAMQATVDATVLAQSPSDEPGRIALGSLYLRLAEQHSMLHERLPAIISYEKAINVLPASTAVMRAVKKDASMRLRELQQS